MADNSERHDIERRIIEDTKCDLFMTSYFAVLDTGYLCVRSLADFQRDRSKYQVYSAGSTDQIKTCDQDCIVLMIDDCYGGSPKGSCEQATKQTTTTNLTHPSNTQEHALQLMNVFTHR